MNKKKGIIIGAVLFILALAVGYALFSDTLTINGTATAKGDFSFEVTTQKGVMEEINTDDLTTVVTIKRLKPTSSGTKIYPGLLSVTGIEASSITNDSNTVTINATMDKLGQKQYFTIKVTNTGTIPLTFDFWDEYEENTTIKGNLIMDDGNKVDPDTIMDMVAGTIENPYELTESDSVGWNQFKASFLDINNVLVPKIRHDEFVTNLETNENAFIEIKTGESFYIIYKVAFEYAPHSNRIKGFEASGTSKIILPIKQYVK